MYYLKAHIFHTTELNQNVCITKSKHPRALNCLLFSVDEIGRLEVITDVESATLFICVMNKTLCRYYYTFEIDLNNTADYNVSLSLKEEYCTSSHFS